MRNAAYAANSYCDVPSQVFSYVILDTTNKYGSPFRVGRAPSTCYSYNTYQGSAVLGRWIMVAPAVSNVHA